MATVEWNIEKALFDRVESFANADMPASRMAFPNRKFDRPDKFAWLEVTHMPNESTRIFLANDEPVWRQGILQVLVHQPLNNKGPKPLTELAGEIALHFPQGLVIWTADQLKLTVAKTPHLMSAGPTEFSWACPVSIEYEINA